MELILVGTEAHMYFCTISTAIYNNDWGMTGKSASKSGSKLGILS